MEKRNQFVFIWINRPLRAAPYNSEKPIVRLIFSAIGIDYILILVFVSLNESAIAIDVPLGSCPFKCRLSLCSFDTTFSNRIPFNETYHRNNFLVIHKII